MEGLKLRPYDAVAITGFLMLPPLFSTGLSTLIEQNNASLWIALLISFAIMLCLFLTTACLMKRYEGRNIIEVTSTVMGKSLGMLYGLMLCVYFCFFTGVSIRENSEILKIYSMKLTPLWVIVGLTLLAAVAMNFFGGRSIVKSAGFFLIIVVLGIVFIMLLGINSYNPDNLVPIFGNGLPDISLNSLFMASLFDSVIVLFLFAPAFSHSSKLKKSGVLALIFTAFIYILPGLCYVMMFSPLIGSKMTSGLIEMGKSIYYNHFFYRFEAIILILLILSSAVQASIGLFISRESLVHTFKRLSLKTIIILCAVLVTIATVLPTNMLELTQIYLPVIREFSIFFMAGFPLLLFIYSSIKRVFKHEKD